VTSRGYSEDVVALTPRMRAVLLEASLGRTEASTALELGVSVSTVKSIRAAAIARLGASNVVAAVALAIRAGEL
jgi:DNA-binding CsgD family transcriptional regulator